MGIYTLVGTVMPEQRIWNKCIHINAIRAAPNDYILSLINFFFFYYSIYCLEYKIMQKHHLHFWIYMMFMYPFKDKHIILHPTEINALWQTVPCAKCTNALHHHVNLVFLISHSANCRASIVYRASDQLIGCDQQVYLQIRCNILTRKKNM